MPTWFSSRAWKRMLISSGLLNMAQLAISAKAVRVKSAQHASHHMAAT